jgi:hypothetical protein
VHLILELLRGRRSEIAKEHISHQYSACVIARFLRFSKERGILLFLTRYDSDELYDGEQAGNKSEAPIRRLRESEMTISVG